MAHATALRGLLGSSAGFGASSSRRCDSARPLCALHATRAAAASSSPVPSAHALGAGLPVCATTINAAKAQRSGSALPRHEEEEDDTDGLVGALAPPPPGCRWRRVMLKISGEALSGEQGFGIDADLVLHFAAEVAAMALEGVQVAVVVGGGNFFRGKDREGRGLDRASADYMGMLATVMNALQLQAALESHGVPTRVQTAIDMKEIAEPYIRRRAIRHLEKGRVVIFGAGTGNPFFTTDTGAALRAAEINAEALLKATKVDGVFDCDPKKFSTAVMHTHLSYSEVIQKPELAVMDTTAITLCAENAIPVVVFNLFTQGNIRRALRGEAVGTRVGGGEWEPIATAPASGQLGTSAEQRR